MAIIKAVSSKSPIKTAIAYISKKEKTDKKLLSGYNLTSPETSYDEMQITKEIWNKTGGRTYKHYVQSFAPNEKITPKQAYAIAKEFVESCPQFKGFEVLIATHQDREHIHTHFILNSVSFEDGHKFQQKSTELQEMKDLSDKICLEHGFSSTQKGRTFDGTEREETTAYKKERYRLLQKAEQGEVKSYVQDIALAVLDCREQAISREDFKQRMFERGYAVKWEDNLKYITFTDIERQRRGEKKCSIRNKKLEKYYHMDFSKEEFQCEFEDNARSTAERERAANIIERAEAAYTSAGINRRNTVDELHESRIKEKDSTIDRTNREAEQQRLRAEESQRIAEQLEREREELDERSKKKSRECFSL